MVRLTDKVVKDAAIADLRRGVHPDVVAGWHGVSTFAVKAWINAGLWDHRWSMARAEGGQAADAWTIEFSSDKSPTP